MTRTATMRTLRLGVPALALAAACMAAEPEPESATTATRPRRSPKWAAWSASAPAVPASSIDVVRANGKTFLPSVPTGAIGTGWDAPARAMQLILKAHGVEASQNDVFAFSGDAFNLCHASHWQGHAYLCIPTNPTANIAAAYGFRARCIHDGYEIQKIAPLKPAERAVHTKAILRQIWDEIDMGRPAIIIGCTDGSDGEWTVVAGYDEEKMQLCHIGMDNTRRWLGVRGFAGSSQFKQDAGNMIEGYWNGRFRGTIREWFAGGWQANPAFLVIPSMAEPTREEAAITALARVPAMFRAPEYYIWWFGGVHFYFGREAYTQWEAAMRLLRYPDDIEKTHPDGAHEWYNLGNIDIEVDQIVRGRTAAAEFCDAAAKLLPKAEPHLARAADEYRKEAAVCRQAFAPFLRPAHDDVPRIMWLIDEAQRERGADAVATMLQHEQNAVTAIESSLAILQPGVPPAPAWRPLTWGTSGDTEKETEKVERNRE